MHRPLTYMLGAGPLVRVGQLGDPEILLRCGGLPLLRKVVPRILVYPGG